MTVTERKHHPASSIFPLLDGDDLDDLVEDIRENGLRVPILVDVQGRIIDGRNRQVACLMAGVEPRYETCDLTDDAEIARLVWSLNEKRRHLTAGQRTAAALKLEEVVERFATEAKKRQSEAGKQYGRGKTNSFAPSDTKLSESPSKRKTSAKIASVAGTSARSVERAKAVKERAPDLFERIEAGELTPNAAYNQLRQRDRADELAAKAEAAKELLTEQPPWLLMQADVMDGLQSVIEHHSPARLIFADPPYNIGVDYGDGSDADSMEDADYLDWVSEWIELCVSALADDGSLWIVISDEYAADYHVLLRDHGLHIRAWIKWYETFGVNRPNNFGKTSRHILYAVIDPKYYVFNAEAVTCKSARQEKYGDKRAAPDGKIWDDVWIIPRVTGTSSERVPGVPTQLPLELVSAVVGCASDPGDLVVDPFSGSGTTGVACVRLGRKYIGIDKSDDFISIAERRIIAEWHDTQEEEMQA